MAVLRLEEFVWVRLLRFSLKIDSTLSVDGLARSVVLGTRNNKLASGELWVDTLLLNRQAPILALTLSSFDYTTINKLRIASLISIDLL